MRLMAIGSAGSRIQSEQASRANGKAPAFCGMNPDEMAERIRQLEEQKNNAYAERNSCVALLARMALALGFKAGIWVDAGQPEEWQNVVFIELPAGQISWHVPAGELFKFDFLSHHPSTWDGHTTEEKYNRVLAPGRLSKLA